jgi:hypothetical protein
MLDENAGWITHEQLQKQIDALNKADEPTPLAWVWEVAVLNGLSNFVTIVHEPVLGSRPDIVFQVDGETVIADVTTVSDKRLHHDNPVDDLNDEFVRRVFPLIQAGLKGGFALSIGEMVQKHRGRENPAPQLRIPRVDRFKAVIFTSEFGEFLHALRHSPNQGRKYRINTKYCDLTFVFNPNGSGWTVNSVRYTQASILNKHNPLWNALDLKRKQLARVCLPRHRGIIVCDGDCEAIKSKGDWDQYGADDIINEFLRDHKSIEFVLTLVPAHKGFRLDLSPTNHSIVVNLYSRNTELPSWLVPIWDFPSSLPQVQNTAQNARYQAEWKQANNKWHESASFRGACMVSDMRIKLSARDLLELLAGVLRQDAFEALPFMARQNPFLNKLRNGQLITAMRIDKDQTDADDDWIVFEFGNPDPAVSPFQVKRDARDTTVEP